MSRIDTLKECESLIITLDWETGLCLQIDRRAVSKTKGSDLTGSVLAYREYLMTDVLIFL